MRTVTHRQMRNESGEILRAVAAGETVQVTNRGQVAALIVPPSNDSFAELISRGEVRVARHSPSSLRAVARKRSTRGGAAILADIRGHR